MRVVIEAETEQGKEGQTKTITVTSQGARSNPSTVLIDIEYGDPRQYAEIELTKGEAMMLIEAIKNYFEYDVLE